jgi:hypothetical protein
MNEKLQCFGFLTQSQWNSDSLKPFLPLNINANSLNETIYLIYPYWQGNNFENYKFDNIQRLGYFAYIINPEDGYPNLTYSWTVTNLVNTAKQHDTKVDLVLFCGSVDETNKFLNSENARDSCISCIVKLTNNRSKLSSNQGLLNADGINVFFPYFDFKLKREFGLFIKNLYWKYRHDDESKKIIVTFPVSDTTQFNYLLGIEKYIDELHFANYDYRGYNPNESLTEKWNASYKSDETDLGFFEQIMAEMLIAEFVNPFKKSEGSEDENKWEFYFLAICAIVFIILSVISLAYFWCKFNQLVVDHLVLSVLLLILLLLEIVFLFFFMVEEMNFDIWLINTNNTNSNFFLLVPIVLIFLFPLIKILQSKRDLP